MCGVTSKSTEESIIDHVIISCDIEEYLESILIDEEGHHSLTKIFKNKNRLITRKSDFIKNSISPGKEIKHKIELKCII